MGRPKSICAITFCPPYRSFRPSGCSCRDILAITEEEIESLRLKNILALDQTAAAKKMGISQSTFQRILCSAYKKVSQAIVEGKELQIIHKEDS